MYKYNKYKKSLYINHSFYLIKNIGISLLYKKYNTNLSIYSNFKSNKNFKQKYWYITLNYLEFDKIFKIKIINKFYTYMYIIYKIINSIFSQNSSLKLFLQLYAYKNLLLKTYKSKCLFFNKPINVQRTWSN